MELSNEVLSGLAITLGASVVGAFAFLLRHAFNSIIEELKGLRKEVHDLREAAVSWRVLESRVELLEEQLVKVLGEG